MKNKLTLLPLLILLCSCNSIKNQKILSYSACENIELIDNSIYTNLQIENQSQKFLLDFATTSTIFSSTPIAESNKPEIGKTPLRKFSPAKNNLFADNNKAFNIVSPRKSYQNEIGNYGYDIYLPKKMGCRLDFDNQQLCNLNESDLKEFIAANNYKEIKSKFNGQSFFFSILIKRKEYQFLFDVGFAGAFLMPYNESIPFLKETNQRVVNHSAVDLVYNNKSISFNGIYYSSAITISKNVWQSKAGMGFIKGFNWIIDANSKKVYVKKNTLSLDILQNNFQNGEIVSKNIP